MMILVLALLGLVCAEVTLPIRKPQKESLPQLKASEPIMEHLPAWLADVKLGSNSKSFALTIDTGSGLLGVYGQPCSACSAVGPTYNPLASTSSAPVACTSLCKVCSGSQCQTQAAYLDGSGWTGNVVTDTVTIAGKSARTNFAYMVNASTSFVQTWEQGILGLAYPGALGYPYPVIGDILKQNGMDNEFWLDLNRDGSGELTLGSPDDRYVNGPLHTINVYATFNPTVYAFYRVLLQDITIDGKFIGFTSDFGLTIVDSGTTLLLLPYSVYIQFLSTINPNLPCKSAFDDKKVCSLTPSEIAQWPVIQITFDNGVIASIWPQDYLQARSDVGSSSYQLGIASSGSKQCLLGDPFLTNRYTGFIRSSNTIQFTDNSASSMAASSLLIFLVFFTV